MNARHYGIFGLTVLGLALAAPVHAIPDRFDGPVVVVKNDRYEGREDRRDDRHKDRRSLKRDDDDYGTGYERRKQKRDDDGNDDERQRRSRR